MLKIRFIITALFLFSTTFAQNGKIAGNWLLEKIEKNGEEQIFYSSVNFSSDGKMLVMQIPVAEWKYDETTNTIITFNGIKEKFNGKNKILRFENEEMVLEFDGTKYFYKKLRADKTAAANALSHLQGVWKLDSDSDYEKEEILKLALPDEFTFVTFEYGSTETVNGNWIYEPEDNSVIFLGLSHTLRGKFFIENTGDNSFVLKQKNNRISAKKKEESKIVFVPLNFTEEDLENVDLDEQARMLPWGDLYEMATTLGNIDIIEYDYAKFDNATKTFTHAIAVSKIRTDEEKPSVTFTNLFVEFGDTSQYSEKTKDDLSNAYNGFFPEEEPLYFKHSGNELVTTEAGDFDCAVFEAVDGEEKVKYWMIKSMPGVFARIIRETTSPFGELEYTVKTLIKISE